MAEVLRTPRAEADLESLLAELDEINPAVAERYAAEFEAKLQALARFPESGRPRSEIALGLRSTLVHPYVLFYQFEMGTVRVLRILHGKMDLHRILKADH
jgi:toxin ParE1/3/4